MNQIGRLKQFIILWQITPIIQNIKKKQRYQKLNRAQP